MKTINLFLLALVLFSAACSQTPVSSQQQDANTFYQNTNGTDVQIIDVRTPEEFAGGYIKGAVNVDYQNDGFNSQVATLDKNKPTYVYCLSGKRSADAANYMRKQGFKSVVELQGGILAYRNAKLPMVTPDNSGTDNLGLDVSKFAKLIGDTGLVMVDFYAPWCGPCKKLAPILEEVIHKQNGLVALHKVDIDKNPTLAQSLNIQSIPLLHLYNNGKLVWTNLGLVDAETLVKAINAAK